MLVVETAGAQQNLIGFVAADIGGPQESNVANLYIVRRLTDLAFVVHGFCCTFLQPVNFLLAG